MTRARASIVGLGLTEQGRGLGRSNRDLRAEALELALADAGLHRRQLDGFIFIGQGSADLRFMGIEPRFAFGLSAGGASPALAVTMAAGAIATGQAEYVACVYGESFTSAPRRLTPNSGDLRESVDVRTVSYGYPYVFGLVGPASNYALLARRYMERFGTTSEQLGAVAVVEREYGSCRPGAVGYGQPITIEDHQASRMVVDPLRLLDCSRPTDGGAAVIVTSSERARDLAGRPVEVLGAASSHAIGAWWADEMFESMNAGASARRALAQAGVTLDDIGVAQLYAPFTIAVLVQLAEYGWCSPRDAGEFVSRGGTRIGGIIPTNTGGGQLSGFYATGFTPLSEGVLQIRHTASSSQVPDVEVALVSGSGGNGGVNGSWQHATLVLGSGR